MTIGGGWGGVAVWAALGLAGSKSPFPIPFAPLNSLRKPFSGSKCGFLSPQPFADSPTVLLPIVMSIC